MHQPQKLEFYPYGALPFWKFSNCITPPPNSIIFETCNFRLFKYDAETELPIRCAQGLGIPAGVNEPGILLSKLSETRRFNGYYNAKGKTNDKIIENLLGPNEKWFNTGDALIYDDEYRLRFMDRLGDTYR